MDRACQLHRAKPSLDLPVHLLAGLERRGGVAAVYTPIAHAHGGGALILLRITLLAHAERLHGEPILLHLHHAALLAQPLLQSGDK